jgi:hypothetical protein
MIILARVCHVATDGEQGARDRMGGMANQPSKLHA